MLKTSFGPDGGGHRRNRSVESSPWSRARAAEPPYGAEIAGCLILTASALPLRARLPR